MRAPDSPAATEPGNAATPTRSPPPAAYHAALNSTSTYDSGSFRVYSYRVMPDQSLKVYAHKAKWSKSWSNFDWKVGKKHQDGMEVAHFRPSQWDSVRSE